ncbi:MAG TPA: Gfo/Idh/MocA family oxidoreductase [Nocardioidaceae bacterium]|nr:Gfo/Idh/MocA family oxidoreductase [Nocardioidaceae bacterium]
MTLTSIGVAVVGAGMAGRAHAAGYRTAPTLYGPQLPEVRLVAVADANADLAADTARRYGYERSETRWQAVAEAPDVDVVSVVLANPLHREVVEGLLAAGKHVLCEKPLAPSIADAEAMVAAAEGSGLQASVGFTFRRSPAIAAVRRLVAEGGIGAPVQLGARYWCDYGVDPTGPMSWRYKGGPGSGALADIGSHVVDLAEFLCGPIASVRGAVLSTVISERAVPLGTVVGHAAAELSDVREPVENEDVVSFNAVFASGATASLSISRVAFGHANSLGFDLFGMDGAASFDLDRPGEIVVADRSVSGPTQGYRTVPIGPAHPYLTGGLPMDFPGVGYGQNDLFSFQARAFLEQVAGIDGLPPCPPLSAGLHNLCLLRAVVDSAAAGGAEVRVDQTAVPTAVS